MPRANKSLSWHRGAEANPVELWQIKQVQQGSIFPKLAVNGRKGEGFCIHISFQVMSRAESKPLVFVRACGGESWTLPQSVLYLAYNNPLLKANPPSSVKHSCQCCSVQHLLHQGQTSQRALCPAFVHFLSLSFSLQITGGEDEDGLIVESVSHVWIQGS